MCNKAAAYTGARREELGQLLVENVLTKDGIPHLMITDLDPEQKVKSQYSIRGVPVPPILISMGFLEFVENRRLTGGRYLFLEEKGRTTKAKKMSEMVPDYRGRVTHAYGLRFSRNILTPLGIKKKGQAIHAMRHSWTDAARRAKINPDIRRMIAGRLDGEDPVEAGYGGADLLKEKLMALKKIEPFLTK